MVKLFCSIARQRKFFLISSQSHWDRRVLFISGSVSEWLNVALVIKGECWKYSQPPPWIKSGNISQLHWIFCAGKEKEQTKNLKAFYAKSKQGTRTTHSPFNFFTHRITYLSCPHITTRNIFGLPLNVWLQIISLLTQYRQDPPPTFPQFQTWKILFISPISLNSFISHLLSFFASSPALQNSYRLTLRPSKKCYFLAYVIWRDPPTLFPITP